MWSNFLTALRIGTRWPGQSVPDLHSEPRPGVLAWYPAVGLIIGLVIAIVLRAGGAIDFTAAALLALIVRAWITGGRNLAALATVISRTDAATPAGAVSGAAAVGVGVFLISQFALFELVALHGLALWLPVVVAWAHFGPLMWHVSLEPIGGGERVGRTPGSGAAARWAILLLIPCFFEPALFAAPAAVVIWRLYLKRVHAGHDAELLSAGVVLVEIATLVALTFTAIVA